MLPKHYRDGSVSSWDTGVVVVKAAADFGYVDNRGGVYCSGHCGEGRAVVAAIIGSTERNC
jgi:hypothetical protein